MDLEGTLISNAISQIARPGLAEFLAGARRQFETLVMFTTVPEERFRNIAELLVRERSAPEWFADIHFVQWSGKTKDLSFVSKRIGDALLLDDYAPYVHLGQEHLWVEVPLFASPYAMNDDGLSVASGRLLERVEELNAASGKMS
ncbi:NIF family HAD-type phosphatase [Stenotrophomonas maltophilia]